MHVCVHRDTCEACVCVCVSVKAEGMKEGMKGDVLLAELLGNRIEDIHPHPCPGNQLSLTRLGSWLIGSHVRHR